MKTKDFIRLYAPMCVTASLGTRLRPSVSIAQLAVETGWGASIKYNNAFGIKGTGDLTPFWNGSIRSYKTHELVDGFLVPMDCFFRSYNSMQDSISDHVFLITHEKRYKPVLDCSNAIDQCKALERCGYATGANYADILVSIIKRHKLTMYDFVI